MTISSTIIVSGGDAGYFPLLSEWVNSIRRFPEGRNAALAILDGGLTAEQTTTLQTQDVQVVRLDSPWPSLASRISGREYLRVNLTKPALDLLFPDYKVILWLDGDTWLQTWDAVPLYAEVAERGKLAVVSQASRLQTHHLRLRKRLFGWAEPRGILFKNARRARLGRPLAWRLADRPVLNAGAYALHRDAPHWQHWRAWQDRCLKHGRLFTSDQLSLALAIYEDGLPYEALPETCNYMGPWRLDRSRGLLVDYYAPYNPVSIVHLAGLDAARTQTGRGAVSGLDLDDAPVDLPLRYAEFCRHFQSGRDGGADRRGRNTPIPPEAAAT